MLEFQDITAIMPQRLHDGNNDDDGEEDKNLPSIYPLSHSLADMTLISFSVSL